MQEHAVSIFHVRVSTNSDTTPMLPQRMAASLALTVGCAENAESSCFGGVILRESDCTCLRHAEYVCLDFLTAFNA